MARRCIAGCILHSKVMRERREWLDIYVKSVHSAKVSVRVSCGPERRFNGAKCAQWDTVMARFLRFVVLSVARIKWIYGKAVCMTWRVCVRVCVWLWKVWGWVKVVVNAFNSFCPACIEYSARVMLTEHQHKWMQFKMRRHTWNGNGNVKSSSKESGALADGVYRTKWQSTC